MAAGILEPLGRSRIVCGSGKKTTTVKRMESHSGSKKLRLSKLADTQVRNGNLGEQLPS